jgi:DNA-binding response OmpR family regulator
MERPRNHPSKQKEEHVVLADDHEQTLAQLSGTFTARGWRVAVTRNGEEALACMREDHPAFCILGGHLPNTNMEQFIQSVRAQYPVLPIIMLTTLELPGDRERYLNAGLTRYLRKPLDEDALDHMLQELYRNM